MGRARSRLSADATLPLHTAPDSTSPLMPHPPSRRPPHDTHAAFRELHGARLHAFALLLTLGDRRTAATVASEALAVGIAHMEELRHPERAAAWLRHRVVRGARRSRRSEGRETRLAALSALGVDPPVVDALAALGPMERAAIVASTIERLDRRDVGDIVSREGAALDRLIHKARARYTEAYASVARDVAGGPIVSHILEVARQAVA